MAIPIHRWRFLGMILIVQYGITMAYDTSVETDLLSSLFNSSTYNRFVRPSSQVNVTVRFVVLSLNELDIKTQTMDISGYLEVEWNDPRLAWSSSNVIASTVNEDTVWYPPLTIVNSIDDLEILYDGITPIRMFSSGNMEWLPLRKFQLHCDTNPSFYPFDTQECPIAITAWSYTSALINLEAASGDVFSLDFYHKNGEWEYVSSSSTTVTVQRAGHDTTTLVITVKFRRRPQFHVINTIMPIMLLGILNGFIFALSVDSGEKMGFVLTVLLAYAVYLTLVADHIPTTSDNMSILSVLLLMILMLSVLSVIATIYVIRLSGRPDDEPISSMSKRLTKLIARASLWRGCRRHKKRADVVPGNVTTPKDKTDDQEREKTWVQDISSDHDEKGDDWDSLTWKEIAEIIDHFCFLWYFIVTAIVSGTCLILLISGYASYQTSSTN